MKKSFVSEWVELIRSIFPPDAKIEVDEGNDVIIRVDWKLGNDPERPNKRSRLIRVTILEEAIEDCNDFTKAGLRFREIIKKRFSNFNPDYNNPREVGTPIEQWEISTFELN